MVVAEIVSECKKLMSGRIDQLHHDLGGISAGRANPALLQSIRVNAYGSDTPLNQVASVNVLDNSTLSVSVYDASLAGAAGKAINEANLRVSVSVAGTLIRVTLPPLTEETRREYSKIVSKIGEEYKVSIRNIRQGSNKDVKDLEKEKELSEDDAERTLKQIQEVTDDYIKRVETITKAKQDEITTI
jgi:ribosome recycling factor